MRPRRFLVAVALGVVALSTFPAQAAPPLILVSGLLTVVVPPTAALSASPTAPTGSLGTTTVVDGRLSSTGYGVTVSTAGFDLVGPPVTTSPATHLPVSAATLQVTATTGGTASPLTGLTFALTYPSAVLTLNLASTYTLSLSLTVPVQAAPGRYTGVVTQTVV